jgi:hypothetical protein
MAIDEVSSHCKRYKISLYSIQQQFIMKSSGLFLAACLSCVASFVPQATRPGVRSFLSTNVPVALSTTKLDATKASKKQKKSIPSDKGE